jgi:hypothetical protein
MNSIKCPSCEGKGFLTTNSSSLQKDTMFNGKPITKKVPKTVSIPSVEVKKGRGRPKKEKY